MILTIKMKILLTGATGFLGAHLLPELLGGGHKVVNAKYGTKAFINA